MEEYIIMFRKSLLVFFFMSINLLIFSQTDNLSVTLNLGFIFTTYNKVNETERLSVNKEIQLNTHISNGKFGIQAGIQSNLNNDPLIADKVITELFITFPLSSFLVTTIGKQNMKWGTARALSSIDMLVAPIDIVSVSDTNRAITALRIDCIPTWWFNISFLAIPTNYIDQTHLAVRSDILVLDTDLSFALMRSFNSNNEEEQAFSFEFAKFFNDFGIYGETQITYLPDLKSAATFGVQVDVPVWYNTVASIDVEVQWQSNNIDAASAFFFLIKGIPLTRKVFVQSSCLFAPRESQLLGILLCEYKVTQNLYLSVQYNRLFDWLSTGSISKLVYTTNRNEISLIVKYSY